MFLIEEQHEIFVVAVTKLEMLAATSQIPGVNERSEKKWTRTRTTFPPLKV